MPGGPMDDAALADRLARWLTARRGTEVAVDEVEHPSAGYSSVTTMVRARWAAHDGRAEERLVVRMAPSPAGTFADYDLTVQHAAQAAAAAAGVPTAAPVVTETDPAWLGGPFTVMPRVDGHIVGEAPPFDRWVRGLGTDGQAELHDRVMETLVLIHRADPGPAVAAGVPARDDAAELAYWDEYLRWSADGEPLAGLVDALHWCRGHAPVRDAPAMVLRWGDVRLGNIVFGDDLAPRAVLDWDMAAVGVPEHDVAWFTVLDLVLATLTGRRVEGFPDRDGVVARYQELSGRSLEHFDWYETFALLRSTAILARIGVLMRAAGQEPAMPVAGSPMLDLLRDRTTGRSPA